MSNRYITYSPALTLVPTYECFNRCSYCNFRVEPGQDAWLSLDEAERQLRSFGVGRTPSAPLPLRPSAEPSPRQSAERPIPAVTEILILSGEVHPQSQRRSRWFQRIYDLCQLALELGFLPHTNVGPLSFGEMEQLKSVNVSLGLMLEQMTPRLLKTVHRHAPSKQPERRLEQLDWAGQLRIPFTTGLLLGIGEDRSDRITTLEAIAQCHQRWGHIQEVILQPHSPGRTQDFLAGAFAAESLIETVALARAILPGAIALQIPPNLAQSPEILLACLEAGARDLGGIGPVDEVNPDYDHPEVRRLSWQLAQAGWELVPRLPVYPQHLSWLAPGLRARCLAAQAAWVGEGHHPAAGSGTAGSGKD